MVSSKHSRRTRTSMSSIPVQGLGNQHPASPFPTDEDPVDDDAWIYDS